MSSLIQRPWTRDYARLSRASFGRVLGDWEQMVGFPSTLASGSLLLWPADRDLDPHSRNIGAAVKTRVTGSAEGEIRFFFPKRMIAALLGSALMLPPEGVEQKATGGFDDMDLEAFREMANLLCGSCNSVYQEARSGLRVSQAVEDLEAVWCDGAEEGAVAELLPEGRLLVVDLHVDVSGEEMSVLQVVPLRTARAIVTVES